MSLAARRDARYTAGSVSIAAATSEKTSGAYLSDTAVDSAAVSVETI